VCLEKVAVAAEAEAVAAVVVVVVVVDAIEAYTAGGEMGKHYDLDDKGSSCWRKGTTVAGAGTEAVVVGE
jgi:hypothetical protein